MLQHIIQSLSSEASLHCLSFCQIHQRCYVSMQGLKTAIIEGDVVGGTCVNRGCVPSKALLAVSGRMRELHDEHHLKALGIQVWASQFPASFPRACFSELGSPI